MNPISIETATGYLNAGLSCLPAARAKKHPSIGSWKTWTGRLPTQIEVEAWFANRQDGICVIAGAVSGNLECMDFDNHGELFEAWMEKIDTSLLGRLVIEQSPSGGYHVLYRSSEPVEGNLKLARGMREGKLTTLIETRGEGGLFLCCPTEGYVLQQGEFSAIPTVTPVEREALLNAARSLEEVKNEELRMKNDGTSTNSSLFTQDSSLLVRPGDDFAARGDIRPYLLAAGWQFLGNHPDGNELWRRPGKTSGGHSATFDGHVFYVFSSNAAPFDSERGYNAFQVYTLLEHRGDFTQAAKTLLDKGYGKRDEAAPQIDFTEFNARLAGEGAKPAPADDEPKPIPVDKLVEDYPKLRPVIINGFLRMGETMNIIAPPKTGKSWLVNDLALSIAMGTEWFGYPCEQGKVLIIDNELHKETSANRLPKIIKARGFDIKKVGRYLEIVNLRGKLKTIEDIGNHVEEYKAAGYKVIIIDAFYRAMPRGVDENDNGAIADVYNLLDRYAEAIGCAFILIHHTSKGNQSQKSVTDVGAGAGSQSRAADTHVILRRHKEEGVVVMESVVRSFPTVKPLCLRWNWPLWAADGSLNPDELEGKMEQPRTQNLPMDVIKHKMAGLVDNSRPLPKTAFLDFARRTLEVQRKDVALALELLVQDGILSCERMPDAAPGQQSTKFVRLLRTPPDEGSDEDSDE